MGAKVGGFNPYQEVLLETEDEAVLVKAAYSGAPHRNGLKTIKRLGLGAI